jgi:ketosteroid isomerase-like protein
VTVADQVPAVSDVLDAIERRDWERFERLLHPDVHWTTAAEEDLHGTREVIDRLARDPPPAPPAWHELHDGRLVRWIDTPG